MAFEDWLIHTCTIKSAWVTTDSYWVQAKNNTALYEDIKCRLGKGSSKLVSSDKKQEHFVIIYKLYVLPEHGQAIKWDTVLVNWETYIIYGKTPVTDGSWDYIIYNITTDEQP